jgi:small-conductance mechanosensitive channel
MYEHFKSIYSQFGEWINSTLWTYNNTTITTFTLLKFFTLIFLTIWIARFVLKTLDKKADKAEIFQRSMIYRLARLNYYIVLTFGFFIALSSIGFDFTSFIWIASALGVGLGFGLQPIFNNFLSGVVLLFESQLKIGDYIELESGLKGEIQEINFRTTTLYTQDGIRTLIPNSFMINARVGINWTPIDPYRCIRVPFSLPFELQKHVLIDKIIDEAKKIPETFEGRSPVAYAVKLTEFRQEYELWVWVCEKDYPSPAAIYSKYLDLVARIINHEK